MYFSGDLPNIQRIKEISLILKRLSRKLCRMLELHTAEQAKACPVYIGVSA